MDGEDVVEYLKAYKNAFTNHKFLKAQVLQCLRKFFQAELWSFTAIIEIVLFLLFADTQEPKPFWCKS